MPEYVTVLTQRVDLTTSPSLVHMEEGPVWVHADDEGNLEQTPPHGHRAYGVFEEAPMVITLDDALGFEKARETALHESIHAMMSVVGLDGLIEGQASGLSEFIVSTISPVLLAFMRDNGEFIAYLQETQGDAAWT